MEIVILGLPQSGKSTLFEIMTGIKNGTNYKTIMHGQTFIPDERLNQLVKIYKPLKISPAKISFIDVHAMSKYDWNDIRQNISNKGCILHIVDGFSRSDVQSSIEAYHKLKDELILSDLSIVQRKLKQLATIRFKRKFTQQEEVQNVLLPKLKECLEAGKPLRAAGLTSTEISRLQSFSFWTIKPELVVVNAAEDNLSFADAFAKEAKLAEPVLGTRCKLQAEINELEPSDRKDFLAAIGAQPAFGRIIRAAFSLLGRISFYTVGQDEVKAWTIPLQTKAQHAAKQVANAIHDDFEREFTHAEVIHYDDFISHDGSIVKTKSDGHMRLEGNEYIVKDGDIIAFNFNVFHRARKEKYPIINTIPILYSILDSVNNNPLGEFLLNMLDFN
jgi:ribosome-binding ATPase YchF (GTP1/OBG family)